MKPTILLTLGLALSLASCTEKETETTDTPSTQTTATNEVDEILLKEAPKEAVKISDLRKVGKPGDEVTFSGAVIGSKQVFVDGRAVMIMGDPTKISACDEHCATPWDVCCDDRDVIKASILTVQVLNEDGQQLKTNLKGVGGLKELSSLTVTGVVAEGSSPTNMIINATGIYVHP